MAVKEINVIGQSKCYSSRWGARIPWWVLHTEEAGRGANMDPYRLHNWMKNNEVSYHYIGGNGLVLDVIDTDYSSWATGDANPRTINAVFAGSRADMSRKEWLDRYSNEIDYFAKLFVEDAAKYDPLAPVVLGKDYRAISAGKAGGIDHSGITFGLGIGNHTDVGQHFPFDFWGERVGFYLGGAPSVKPELPVINQINLEAERAAAWIGRRLNMGESGTPDGIGKFSEFENGVIYWSPGTGAHAVPDNIFETYIDYGYEAGALGYPIGDHTVLTGPDGAAWGDVQGFEGGAIYRRYGQPGFAVWGRIRDAWNRSGFENGTFGWPTGKELKVADDVWEQSFEKGRIVFSGSGELLLSPVGGDDKILTIAH